MGNGFVSNRDNVERQLARNKAAALEALGLEFTSHAVEEMDRLIYNAPLPKSAANNPRYERTGRLRSGQVYQVSVMDDEVVVGNNIDYAIHVHFEGITRNWGGLPWMTNTINNKQTELKAVVETVIVQGFS